MDSIIMLEFQEKKKIRNILYSKFTLIVLFIVLFFIARATISVYYKQKTSEENLAKAKEDFIDLEKREKILNSEIDRLKTDKGTEEEIRKKFMVGKSGEQVIIIVDDNNSAKDSAVKNKNSKNIFSRFFDLFR